MGFSRGVQNILMWGAPGRVDAAKEAYNSSVRKYKTSCNKISGICSSIDKLKSEITIKKFYVESHASKLRHLYNMGFSSQLSQHEKNILDDYINNKILLPNTNIEIKYMTDSDFHEQLWEDDPINNIAGSIAVTIFPFGFIGAHMMASEEVEKIQAKESEVIEEIGRLSSVIVKLTETESKLKKVDKAYDCLIGLCQK